MSRVGARRRVAPRARPQPRTTFLLSSSSDADALAFAVHAYILADGYALVAAGAAADGDALPADAGDEVGPAGWDALDGRYAFRYVDGAW